MVHLTLCKEANVEYNSRADHSLIIVMSETSPWDTYKLGPAAGQLHAEYEIIA